MAVIVKLLSKFDDSGIRKAKSSFGGLNKTLGAVGIGLGLGQIANYATNAVKGFEQAEIASSKLASVMQSMGVGMATQRVDAYAESLQDLTAVDADIIKAAQTKLATFANLNKTINKSGGAFDRATVAAIDLAAAGFGSIESNAVQLGKAMNDPIKGISSLTRNGITFTAQEKLKIKTLVQSNKTLEAQDLILKAIEKQVGGTAEAGVSVFDRLNRSMESVSDEVGKILLPYMKDFADFLMTDVVPNVKAFLADLSNPDTQAGKTFLQIKTAVEQTYNGVKDFFALFGDGDAMKGFGNVATELVKALPALLALKGIMMLASGGKAIASLVTAMSIIAGKSVTPTGVPPVAGAINPVTAIAVGSTAATLAASTAAQNTLTAGLAAKGMKVDVVSATFTGSMALPYDASNPFLPRQPKTTSTTNNVTINVQGGDPKVLVNTLSQYVKQNGSLPFNLSNPPTRKIG
jgi:ribosomal protein L12E/L44/L45/RPP1/RPP2